MITNVNIASHWLQSQSCSPSFVNHSSVWSHSSLNLASKQSLSCRWTGSRMNDLLRQAPCFSKHTLPILSILFLFFPPEFPFLWTDFVAAPYSAYNHQSPCVQAMKTATSKWRWLMVHDRWDAIPSRMARKEAGIIAYRIAAHAADLARTSQHSRVGERRTNGLRNEKEWKGRKALVQSSSSTGWFDQMGIRRFSRVPTKTSHGLILLASIQNLHEFSVTVQSSNLLRSCLEKRFCKCKFCNFCNFCSCFCVWGQRASTGTGVGRYFVQSSLRVRLLRLLRLRSVGIARILGWRECQNVSEHDCGPCMGLLVKWIWSLRFRWNDQFNLALASWWRKGSRLKVYGAGEKSKFSQSRVKLLISITMVLGGEGPWNSEHFL